MRIRRKLLLSLAVCLSIYLLCGCQTAKQPSWNESGSVLTMLGLGDHEVLSLVILNAADGQSVTIENADQINRVLKRLDQIQIIKNIGTKGYTLNGYGLTFSTLLDNGIKEVSIQLDINQYDDLATYGGYFYKLSDQGNEDLNDYISLEEYKYQ
jgi:hypothetical protein